MYPFSCESGWVCKANRIVPTVGKHIVAQQTLAGGGEDICIDESTNLRIIIPGLEVVEPGFSIVVVAAIPEGVHVSKNTGLGNDIAPSIVGITCNTGMTGIIDCQHIALEVLSEVILPPGGVPGIP